MPVLLEPDRAPALSELLKAIPGGLVQRVVQGSGDFVDPPIAGLGALTSAGPSEISFIVHAKYLPQMSQTRACAVIVLPEIDEQLAASDVTFARLLGAAERGGGAALAQLLDELLVCGCHGASSLNPGG